MTQTQITLTMDMDDVLEHIRNLVLDESHVLEDITSSQLDYAVNAIEQAIDGQGDIRHVLIYLDTFRKDLVKADTRILECMTILEGHYNQSVNTPVSEAEQVFQAPSFEDLQKHLAEVAKEAKSE